MRGAVGADWLDRFAVPRGLPHVHRHEISLMERADGSDVESIIVAQRYRLQSNLGFSSAVAASDPIHDAIREGQGFTYLTYQLTPRNSA